MASRLTDIDGRERLRVLGPLYERAVSADGDLRAVRPFWAHENQLTNGWSRDDYLWPLGFGKEFNREHTVQFGLVRWTDFDVGDPESRYRFWLFPLYFQGRDAKGQDYTAVFPLGGSIHEFLMQDEIDFALFPVWLRHSVNGIGTDNVLFPIYAHTDEKGIYRDRVFPLYGYLKHRGQFEKRFILWPFWTQARYDYRQSQGYGYVFFPFWGHIRLTDQEQWMVLPPLFRFARGQQMNETLAPWPFFQYQSGKRRRLYLFPFYGRKSWPERDRMFVLWPVGWRFKSTAGDSTVRNYRVLPFFYYDTRRLRHPAAGEDDLRARRFECWPLASWQRAGEDRQFQCLDLWPGRDPEPVARSWAPLWTLAGYRARGEDSDLEVLWGLLRRAHRDGAMSRTSLFPLVEWERDRRDGADAHAWSVLKGLIGYERAERASTVRLLYVIRIHRGETAPSSHGNQTTSSPR